MRKDPLISGEIYHVFNKSIAEYKIFNNNTEYLRIFNVVRYYQREKPNINFSNFFRSAKIDFTSLQDKRKLVEIICYCFMPTHLHLVLKQLQEDGISIFMNNIQNSYTRYFNIKHNRKGPLWESRFKSVLVKTDEQLLHLTRYVHLNPVTAYLVNRPEEWQMSSYREFIFEVNDSNYYYRVCNFKEILDIKPNSYREFVEDRISFQRELAKIKDLIFE